MSAVREQSLAGLAVRLGTLIAGWPGLQVFRNRRGVLPSGSLAFRDPPQASDVGQTGMKRHTMTVVIGGFLEADSDDEIGPLLNELYRRVIDALEADTTLGATPGAGPAVDVRELGLDTDLEEAADGDTSLKRASGSFYLSIEIEFTTRHGAAGSIAP